MSAGEKPIVEVLPPRVYATKTDVIEAIGGVMVGAGAVAPAYVEGMLRKELEGATVVAPEVALPHGTADVRAAVQRNMLVVAPIPGGVQWSGDRPVRVAIGFAGTGDEAHLRLLGTVARVLADDDLVERLKAGADAARLAALFE